ncbi:MAG: TIGR01777 family oxidoreductase [Anaerolineae bacterium]|nr:TIGR01777 family oxidoreductase [Anaerolineae bacterium]
MQVIIAGGSGLIGRALTAELTNNGHTVTLLSRRPESLSGLPAGVRAVGWDGKSAAGWGPLADGAGAIVNLAGENIAGDHFFPSRWTANRRQRIRQSRVNAGQAIVAAITAAKQKPAVLVQSSAVGYYGPRGDEPVDENSPAGDDFLAEVCGDWEGSTHAVESLGVRRVVARTGVVFSTHGGAFTRLALPFKLFAGGPLGHGRQYYSWIHINDQAAALRFLIENSTAQGIYNLTAPQPVTSKHLAQTLGRVMKRPAFVPVPGFAFRLAFGAVAATVLEGQRALPSRLQQAGFEFQFPEIEGAVRHLLAP